MVPTTPKVLIPLTPHSPVALEKDISLEAVPHKRPMPYSPRVLIVGGGVIGLVTAWVLLDKGYHVTVLSKEWASYTQAQRLASQIAGALWEYPPAVCGHHTDAISLRYSKRWSLLAYNIWSAIAADPELSAASGVRMKRATFFFYESLENLPRQFKKMQEIMNTKIQGFNRNIGLAEEYGVNPNFGVKDAYEYLAPVIDTDRAMAWLMEVVKDKGGKFVTETITGDLLDIEDDLLRRFDADVIVNATGLASAELAGDDSCYPIRGGLIRVINDGKNFPKIEQPLAMAAEGANEIVFIVPRNENILLLGGCTEAHQWDLDLTLDSPIMKRLRARCETFLPCLKNALLDTEYPLSQGLRPFRASNVRVERELRLKKIQSANQARTVPSRIIHSYGQGGAGWSLSFGCASDVASLVQEALHDIRLKEMSQTFKDGFI